MNHIYIECPMCRAVENHEFNQGKSTAICQHCFRTFKVEMMCIPVYEKGKTTVVLSAKTERVRNELPVPMWKVAA
jgi:hypothetical protein